MGTGRLIGRSFWGFVCREVVWWGEKRRCMALGVGKVVCVCLDWMWMWMWIGGQGSTVLLR